MEPFDYSGHSGTDTNWLAILLFVLFMIIMLMFIHIIDLRAKMKVRKMVQKDKEEKWFFAVKKDCECRVFTVSADGREDFHKSTGLKQLQQYEIYDALSWSRFNGNYEIELAEKRWISVPYFLFISKEDLLDRAAQMLNEDEK